MYIGIVKGRRVEMGNDIIALVKAYTNKAIKCKDEDVLLSMRLNILRLSYNSFDFYEFAELLMAFNRVGYGLSVIYDGSGKYAVYNGAGVIEPGDYRQSLSMALLHWIKKELKKYGE